MLPKWSLMRKLYFVHHIWPIHILEHHHNNVITLAHFNNYYKSDRARSPNRK
jgi:hypothetical protein